MSTVHMYDNSVIKVILVHHTPYRTSHNQQCCACHTVIFSFLQTLIHKLNDSYEPVRPLVSVFHRVLFKPAAGNKSVT